MYLENMDAEEDFEGCISCMKTNDLCDLFAVYAENTETYAKILETCFNVKVSDDVKYICTVCVQKLEDAAAFKDQTVKGIAMVQGIKDEEYLDEALLEEEEDDDTASLKKEICNEIKSDCDSSNEIDGCDDNTCVYCEVSLPSRACLYKHVRVAHGVGRSDVGGGGETRHACELCSAVFLTSTTLRDHRERCHGATVSSGEGSSKQFPCHFCENVFSGRKACYTHLRMKHGLKLSTEQTPKYTPRVRKKCHICNKDFSQKQILNKHLWKMHGYEVEKRKAFICPLCDERVSYGHHFDQHLLSEHRLKQRVETLEFNSMDEFLVYKGQIQEQTRCRFRKTTASKHTIEGLRSHYMCSQSGVYVYQGKGIRPAPERQIYKTGKACPAHIVVTESVAGVRVVFHSTHVGHGACPYYEPREPRPVKTERCRPTPSSPPSPTHVSHASHVTHVTHATHGPHPQCRAVSPDLALEEKEREWVCDACGLTFLDGEQFTAHAGSHGVRLFPCHYCDNIFENVDAWTSHLRSEHNIGSLF